MICRIKHSIKYIRTYHKQNLAVISPTDKYSGQNIVHIINIINNVRLSYAAKTQLLQTYCSIVQYDPYNKNKWTKYHVHYNVLINNPSVDPEIVILDKILLREESVSKILFEYYAEIESADKKDAEYTKRLRWINYALGLPTEYKQINTLDKKSLQKIRFKIDSTIYKMDHVKDDLLSVVYAYATNPKSAGNSIALYGKPGTGKTDLVMKMAALLDLPFIKIPVGNIKDASFLVGSPYTYVHSGPGHIVKSIIRLGFKNGIIFLDEVDKLAEGLRGDEILGTLMHLCDPTQNNSFADEYLDGIPIDMSSYLFIYSLNNMDKMNKALLSRIGQNIIEVDNYDSADKMIISQKFIIPVVLKELGLDGEKIHFDEHIISYIITDCMPFATHGIRELKGTLLKICRMVNYYNMINPDAYSYPIVLDRKMIDRILNKKRNINVSKYIL